MLPSGEGRELPVIAGITRRTRVEPRFGRIASSLAHKDVQVHCWSLGDWQRLMREASIHNGRFGPRTLGFAGIDANWVNLAPGICEGLVDMAYKHRRPTDVAAELLVATGVVTLTHEAQHSRGVVDEAEAECNAIQLAQRTAIALGASRAYAASLVRTYWRHYEETLNPYRSSECRKNGALDLRNADSIWP